MLMQLEIRRLATIAEASLEFAPGLNIVSGMSGAGKSILLRSLDLALGGRFSQKLIREGADSAEVAALFQLPADLRATWAEPLALEGDELLIRRKFRRDGQGSSSANGRLISAAELQALGKDLASMLSQDESMGLREPEVQLGLLDTYAGLLPAVETFRVRLSGLRDLESRAGELERQAAGWQREQELLAMQHEELARLAPREGEEAELASRYAMLAHAGEITAACEALEKSGRAFSATLMTSLRTLDACAGAGGEIGRLVAEGRNLGQDLEEWLREISREGSRLEADPATLARMDERLRLLRQAFKKYRLDEAGLCRRAKELAERMKGPPPALALEKLREEVSAARDAALKLAMELHAKRQAKAKPLARRVNERLERLEMPGERFAVSLERADKDALSASGVTALEFLLRSVPGAPLLPLAHAASGGERSRALLAICAALSDHLRLPLLVFDEIDTSIGSRLGKPVADCFRDLASGRQVICVTHLAPVAAGGQAHFLVEKDAAGSRVRRLSDQERLEELAQMIAGEGGSATARKQAEHMLAAYR